MAPRATLSRATAGAAVFLCIGFGLALAGIAPLQRGLLLLAIALWFALPGLPFARRVYAPPRGVVPLIAGAIWGYAASCLVLLGFWVAGARHAGLLLGLSPVLAGAALAIAPAPGPVAAPAPVPRDRVVLFVLLLLVPLVVGRPFSRVGELTPDGRTYRAYFTADFVWRMAVAAEVAKGDVPPRNQFFRGDDLRYYWLPDLLPAVEYRALGRRLRLEQVLLVNALAIDAMFVAFLYAFARHWTSSAAAAGIGAAAAILLGSFEGAERLLTFARDGIDYGYLRMINIDAVTRWYYGSLPVDGLQRVLFWQPQHAMGYALGYAALLVVWHTPTAPRPRAMALSGTLLAAGLFFSSLSAIMLGVIVGVTAAGRFLAVRDWKLMLVGGTVAAVPIAAAVGCALRLHYVDRGDSLVRLLVNPAAITHPWLSIFLSFGAMLPAAIAGSWLGARGDGARRLVPLWTAIVVAFLFYFFVDVRDHQYVYVGWRAGHMIFIAAAPLAAVAVERVWQRGRAARLATVTAGVLLGAAAVPTAAIDIYNAQDTANRAQGPGFRWTLVLSPDELAALDWVRRYTPADAVVQIEPHVRDRDTWAYIPTFAERRMSAGIPISMVPLDKYLTASARVRDLYRATDARTAHRIASALGIDYLMIGSPERDAYPQLERTLNARPEDFRPVFRNGSMAIYFVERARSETADRR